MKPITASANRGRVSCREGWWGEERGVCPASLSGNVQPQGSGKTGEGPYRNWLCRDLQGEKTSMGRSQARPGGQWCPGLSLSSLSCVASPLRSQNSAREAGRGGSPITDRRLRQRGMFLPAHQPWMPPAKLAAPPRAHSHHQLPQPYPS